jgi:hypothetical protein
MLFLYLHKDIIKHVLNLYIDLRNEGTKLENIICKYHKVNFRFYIKPHLIYRIIRDEGFNGIISVKETIVDDIIVKTEQFHQDGRRDIIGYLKIGTFYYIRFDHFWNNGLLLKQEDKLIFYAQERDLKFLNKLKQISEHKYIYK